MTDVQKPVEEQTAPAADQPTSTDEQSVPAVAAQDPAAVADEPSAVAAEPTGESPEAAQPAEPAAEEAPAPAAKEFAGEGVVGYKKTPGGFIKKVLGFQKKYLWVGGDAVDTKNLAGYLSGEKSDHVNHNAAWASQTGNGLLFYSKNESEKANPVGVFNLAEITEITEEGTVDFHFQAHGSKHIFQCTGPTERDGWVVLLKEKVKEAVELVEGIKSSEGYKEQYAKLSKSATPAIVASSSKAEAKKEEKAEEKEEKKERKSRSVSRKRNSIFGNFALGSKKEEKEEKVADLKEAAAPAEATATDGPAEGVAEVTEPPKEDAKSEDVAPASPVETKKPAIGKRNSVFGTLTSRFGSKKTASEPKADAALAAKDEPSVDQVAADAPVIPAPEASEPLADAVQSPATEETPATNGDPITETKAEESKPETKPAIKSDKRKSSLPFGFGSTREKTEKAPETDGEKPKSPFAKIRQTIKGKSSSKTKTADKPAENAEQAASEPATTSEPAGTATEPVVSDPVPAIQPSQEVSAAA